MVDRGGRSMKTKRGRPVAFTRMAIEYFRSEKSGMGYFTEIDPVEMFEFSGEGSLGRLTFASAAVELLYDLLPKNEPYEALYDLTLRYFRLINEAPKGSIIAVFLSYFLKLLSFLGYRPNLAGCNSCGKGIGEIIVADSEGEMGVFFSPERGGLVCEACQKPGEYYIKLHLERIDKLYNLQISSLAEAVRLKIKMTEAEEMIDLLTGFLRYQTEAKELKSLKFLEKLKKTDLKA